jgi:hypothetical protein
MELGLSILAVLLATISLIALWPSLEISAKEPIDHAQPFSVPFQITNTSYYPLKNIQTYVYAHRVLVGGITATSNLMKNDNWRADHLSKGESITIISNFIHAPMLPAEADIVIAVDYKIVGIPFVQERCFTRFIGNFSGANWQWLKQPSKEVQANASRMISKINS